VFEVVFEFNGRKCKKAFDPKRVIAVQLYQESVQLIFVDGSVLNVHFHDPDDAEKLFREIVGEARNTIEVKDAFWND